jgi:polyisoprenoid-binding protein YceI
MKHFTIALLVLLFNTAMAQTKWTLDKAHTEVKFAAPHMMISEVEGEFKDFDGTVVSTKDDFEGSEITFVAQVASIDTDNERRDNHLKSDDFFNAEAHPELKFAGKIEKEGEEYFLVGDLTMRDVTKAVKFPVKYNGQISTNRGKKAGFKVTGTVNRFDYGLKFDSVTEAGGLVVGEDIDITANIELNEATEQ